MDKTAVKLKISGGVQGVGFRAYVARIAVNLGLSGSVRNLPDGTVEALLQGSQEDVERGVQFCRKGPPFSKVQDLQATPHTVDDLLDGFQVE